MFHGLQALTSYSGKGFKTVGNDIRGRGYSIHTWQIDAVKCGASLWLNYVVTLYYPDSSTHKFPMDIITEQSVSFCRNVIKYYGPKPSPCYPISRLEPIVNPIDDNMVGTIFDQAVNNWDGPFCETNPSSWILIPDYGIRQFQFEEMSKLKGQQDSHYSQVPYSVFVNSIEQHLWVTICKVISPLTLLSSEIPLLPPLTSPIHPNLRQQSQRSVIGYGVLLISVLEVASTRIWYVLNARSSRN